MVVTSSGDAGDVVYLLSILQAIPEGPHDLLIEEKDEFTGTGRITDGPQRLVNFIHRLVSLQPYIKSCRMIEASDFPRWRSGGFRRAGLHSPTAPLLIAHLNHFNKIVGTGLEVDTSKPWITVDKSPATSSRVVINRTSRYRNHHFPWRDVVSFYGPRLLFVGLPHEHKEFCETYGFVDYLPTGDMLDLAQAIAGSFLFIGNQSCAFALAEGMKHNAIQETSLKIPDCIFKRDNVQHVYDGYCILPDPDGGEGMRAEGMNLHTGLVSTMITPPGTNGSPPGWQYPGIAPAMTFTVAEELVCGLPSMHGKSKEFVREEIKKYNLDRCRSFYRPRNEDSKVFEALRYAGY